MSNSKQEITATGVHLFVRCIAGVLKKSDSSLSQSQLAWLREILDWKLQELRLSNLLQSLSITDKDVRTAAFLNRQLLSLLNNTKV